MKTFNLWINKFETQIKEVKLSNQKDEGKKTPLLIITAKSKSGNYVLNSTRKSLLDLKFKIDAHFKNKKLTQF